MSIISIPFSFSPGGTIISSQVNSCFSVIYNDYNGSIGNSNLSSSIVISDTKLAQIVDAGKVSGTALTQMNLLPSGAGILPIANLPAILSSSSILNYGTSSSASTPVSPSSLFICYGTLSATTVGTNITNLPFTSSTTYCGVCQGVTSSQTMVLQPISGSTATVTVQSSNTTVNWIAIGY